MVGLGSRRRGRSRGGTAGRHTRGVWSVPILTETTHDGQPTFSLGLRESSKVVRSRSQVTYLGILPGLRTRSSSATHQSRLPVPQPFTRTSLVSLTSTEHERRASRDVDWETVSKPSPKD